MAARTQDWITDGTTSNVTTGITADSIRFNYMADTNNDGIPDSQIQTTYFHDANNNLNRTNSVLVNGIIQSTATHVIASNITTMWITYFTSFNNGTWNDDPANPPVPPPASWDDVDTTLAVGITLVGQSTNINLNKDINSPMTFTDPRDPTKTIIVNDQLDYRMASSIIELKNLNSKM
jgi:hypothetical protein